jgi:nicotinate-nucleotide--dimethylbenzimidazole phosphoribosyltransferase
VTAEARLATLIARVQPLDEQAMALARSRQERLTKPPGSMGRLEDLSIQLAGMQRKPLPTVEQPLVIVAVGDHGVAAQGVSAYPQAVTGQMILNFLAGGAVINALSRQADARLVVLDAGTLAQDLEERPGLVIRRARAGTRDFTVERALTRDEVYAAIESGIATFETELGQGVDLVAVGEMGIANTTAAAALTAAFTGAEPALVTGAGTGVDAAGWERKRSAVERALALHRPNPADAADSLTAVGGLEICALAGVMVAAAANGVPVLLDGFITGAAALAAVTLAPQLRPYLVAAHCSVEPGHRIVLEWLGLKPLLDLGLRLGEGSGAALAIHLARAACRILGEVATFESAGVSERAP